VKIDLQEKIFTGASKHKKKKGFYNAGAEKPAYHGEGEIGNGGLGPKAVTYGGGQGVSFEIDYMSKVKCKREKRTIRPRIG